MVAERIIFRKHLSIGEAAAEQDSEFLRNCFVNSGDVDLIKDTNSPKCILLGRTGSGKSALIQHIIDTEDNVISLSADELSITYVCNSDIITYFDKLGVNLDIFYQLLWRHVLAVELIRHKYRIRTESEARSFFSKVRDLVGRDPKKEAALEYLGQWGSTFWLETEHRVKEVTSSLEARLDSAVGFHTGVLAAKLGSQNAISAQEKEEVLHKAQNVVNSVQISALGNVMKLLRDDVFNDGYTPYYIVIDRLDENWVDDVTRYKLIRALIEAIKSFRTVNNVKIIIALRNDLLDRVFMQTRDSGFQSEKYESLLLRLRWSHEQLKDLVDKRINYLLKMKYTKSDVKFVDLFPHKVRDTLTFDYMLERTLFRPRDIISFVNECLEKAEGKADMSTRIVLSAEGTYSQKRFDALQDEWGVEHPLLRDYCAVRRRKTNSFGMSGVTDKEVDDLALTLVASQAASKDALAKCATEYFEGRTDRLGFFVEWIKALYKIGVIGIKPDTFLPVRWSYDAGPTIPSSSVTERSIFYVHPMVWRTLGVSEILQDNQET